MDEKDAVAVFRFVSGSVFRDGGLVGGTDPATCPDAPTTYMGSP